MNAEISMEAIERSRAIHARFKQPTRPVNWIKAPAILSAKPVAAPQSVHVCKATPEEPHDAHVMEFQRQQRLALAQSWEGPFARMVREVAAKHGLTVEELKGPSRKKRVVRPRQEAMYRGVTELKMSYPDVARRLGGRDHTTALHGVEQHRKRMAEAGQ